MSVGGGPLVVKITYSHHSFIEMAFSTDSQDRERSHTTLTSLLFDIDIKISLVLLDEFIYLYLYISLQGARMSYGALTM